MAEQETIDGTVVTFDPAQHGLWRRYAHDGHIDHAQWLRACNTRPREFVGTCRHCGRYLTPRSPDQIGTSGRFDYEAQCPSGHIINAPGGRVQPWKKGGR